MTDNIDQHTDRIKARYEGCLEQHTADSPEAVHWTDEERMRLRYDILKDIGELEGKTILDFGCGTGLFLDYLNVQNISCEYHGWDISEKMIESAKERHPDATFECKDVLKEDVSEYTGEFDYIFISGVFHIKTDSNAASHQEWMYSILEEIWPLCTQGLSVNFMTEHIDWMDDDLYYCEIGELIDFCVENLDRWVTVRRDYELWEHTLYVYKNPQESP